MALVLADRVKETAAAPGTGTVTLLGAVSGFQSFSVVGNANTTYYTIADQSGTNWEVGVGTYTSSGTTLARTTVLASSNAGALVNFSSGVQDVFVTYPAEVATPYSSVQYTYTGVLAQPPVFAIEAPTPFQSSSGAALQSYSGVWATVKWAAPSTTLASFTFSNLQGSLGALSPGFGGGGITALSFPELVFVNGGFGVTSAPSLTTFSAPKLQAVFGTISIQFCGSLSTLNFPALQYAEGFSFSSVGAIASMDLSSLQYVGGAFSLSVATMTAISAPSLLGVSGNMTTVSMTALASVSYPALQNIGGVFTLTGNPSLTTVTLSSLVRIGYYQPSANLINISNNTPALATFLLPSTLKQMGISSGGVNITSAALTQASVDSILVALAALNGTNGTTTFNNRTVTITGTSSAPSATGAAAKATLVARGCTVTTN